MKTKSIDWGNLGFQYLQTDFRSVSSFKDKAWDAGTLTQDATVQINESACVLQYAQICFEGRKAYTTADGEIVRFRPQPERQPHGGFLPQNENTGISGGEIRGGRYWGQACPGAPVPPNFYGTASKILP